MRYLKNVISSDVTPYSVQWLFGILSVFITLFIKKTNPHVVLTSFHGDGYRGNTKIIFEHLQTNGNIKAVWLSRNKEVVKQLKSKFGEDSASLTHSFSGLMLLCRANVVCFTHGTSDFPFMRLNRSSLILQTYHGLPTKCGEYMRPSGSPKINFFHKLILKYRFAKIDYFLSSSDFVSKIFAKRFGLKRSQFIETGFPAYDRLINSKALPNSNEKIVLYAPTYRYKTHTQWFPFPDFDLNELYEFLEMNNVKIALRPHPNETTNFNHLLTKGDRIFLADDSIYENINTLLLKTDVIITDYSGIYLEGLLRDIPPIFIPYDIDGYERGIPYSYHKVTPGPKVRLQQEFIEGLNSALEGAESYAEDRKRVKSTFFSNTDDGRATERVSSFLERYILDGQIINYEADSTCFESSPELSEVSTGL